MLYEVTLRGHNKILLVIFLWLSYLSFFTHNQIPTAIEFLMNVEQFNQLHSTAVVGALDVQDGWPSWSLEFTVDTSRFQTMEVKVNWWDLCPTVYSLRLRQRMRHVKRERGPVEVLREG